MKFLVLSAILASQIAFAEDFTVTMSFYSKYPNGNYASYDTTSGDSITLMPANQQIGDSIESLRKTLTPLRDYAVFTVSGPVIKSGTTRPSNPRFPEVDYHHVLVNDIEY